MLHGNPLVLAGGARSSLSFGEPLIGQTHPTAGEAAFGEQLTALGCVNSGSVSAPGRGQSPFDGIQWQVPLGKGSAICFEMCVFIGQAY